MHSDEPSKKLVHTFFDCQNLFKSLQALWGYDYPNFDPIRLAKLMVNKHKDDGWVLDGIHLYTGIHDVSKNSHWHNFWVRKLNHHKGQDPRVTTFTTPLRYSNDIAREKGIDVRISLDMVRMARLGKSDVVVVFSQDNDFKEVAEEIRTLAKEKQCWIKIASAYPYDPAKKLRGVDKTDWNRITKCEYDSCIDPNDYR